jgi:hypothetical protein
MKLKRLPALVYIAFAWPAFGQTDAQCTLLAQRYGKERSSLSAIELAQLQNCLKADLDKATSPNVGAMKDGSRTAQGISDSTSTGTASGSASGSASPSSKHAAPPSKR